MIEVSALSKQFGRAKPALDGISLVIPSGQIFGILGPNGAGKTTLLRILSTLLIADSGTAVLAGFDVLKNPQQVRQNLGILNADMALYPRLTGRENLNFFAGLYGLGDVSERISELADWLQIGPWIDQRISSYSTGMRQKINIARSVLHRPKVLILDEASNGLDVMARVSLVEAARRHAEAGNLVLYSTHVMSEAESLCKRLAILIGGKLVAQGETSTLIETSGQKNLEQAFLYFATSATLPAEAVNA